MDLVVRLAKPTTYVAIQSALKEAFESPELKGIVACTEDATVPTDFFGYSASSIFDATGGIILNEKFVKLITIYDNEWGYSRRLCDLLVFAAKEDPEAWVGDAGIALTFIRKSSFDFGVGSSGSGAASRFI